jgi:hypothetical protein
MSNKIRLDKICNSIDFYEYFILTIKFKIKNWLAMNVYGLQKMLCMTKLK